MASDLEFVQFVCDQAQEAGGISHRKMFGEFAVYLDGKVVGLVCDNRLFVKPTEPGRRLLGQPPEGLPYPGAKPHFLLDDHLDDGELLSAVFRATADALPPPRPKRRKAP